MVDPFRFQKVFLGIYLTFLMFAASRAQAGVSLAEVGGGVSRSQVRLPALQAGAEFVETRTSLEIEKKTVSVSLTSPDLFKYPFLIWSSADGSQTLSEDERDHLRRYLRFGGFLWIDDQQGTQGLGFDAYIRKELALLFPNQPLRSLSQDHTVFRSFYLIDRAYGRIQPSRSLEGIDLQGRTVVIYSPNDLFGAMSRDPFGNYEYRLGSDEDRIRRRSFQLWVNVLFYALCDDYKKDALHVDYILKRRRLSE